MTETLELARRFFDEAWNRGRLELIPGIMAQPYRVTSLNHGAPPLGPQTHADIAQHVVEYRRGFSDLEVVIVDTLAVADRAFIQTRLRGTHDGVFLGMTATGRAVDIVLSAVFESVAGKLTGHTVLVDMLGLLQQLGVPMPAPGAPPNAAPPSPQ
ncbi:MAG: ester cyclase [Pseudomonadales bacterium]|nr:ester cyclase [Halioglobus sp.]MCP5190642.1 ester cyclase [Pseudomonadales bacterium]